MQGEGEVEVPAKEFNKLEKKFKDKYSDVFD